MNDAQVRIWALEYARLFLPPRPDAAALVHAAEPLADWVLGCRRAAQAFPGEGEGFSDPFSVDVALEGPEVAVIGRALTLGSGKLANDEEQGRLSAIAGDCGIGHTDSAGGVNDPSVGGRGQVSNDLAPDAAG